MMSWMVAGKSTVTLPIQRTPSATRATMPRSSSDTVISSTASGLPSAFSTTLRSGFSGISDAPSSPSIRASTSWSPSTSRAIGVYQGSPAQRTAWPGRWVVIRSKGTPTMLGAKNAR